MQLHIYWYSILSQHSWMKNIWPTFSRMSIIMCMTDLKPHSDQHFLSTFFVKTTYLGSVLWVSPGCFLYSVPLIPLTVSKPFPTASPGRHSLPKQIIAGRTGARVKSSGTLALTQLQPESCRKWLRFYPLHPDRPGDPRNKAFPSPCDWSDFPVCTGYQSTSLNPD